MYCTACGNELPEGSEFCPYCGARLAEQDPDRTVAAEPADDAWPWPDDAPADQAGPTADAPTQVRLDPVVPGAAPRRAVAAPAGQAPYQRPARPAGGPAPVGPGGPVRHRNFLPLAIALGVVAVALVGVAVALGLGLIGPRAEPSPDPVLKAETPLAPIGDDDDDEERPAEEGSVEGVPVRGALGDYSWGELALLGQALAATDDAGATETAIEYGLLSADGTLPGDTKELELSDGTSVRVAVAGIRHDEAQGGGVAGLTLVATTSLGDAVMNPSKTSGGGWSASELRASLAGDVRDRMPDELRDNLVAVGKRTNNAGETDTTTSVNVTYDEVWLLSLAEVGGTVPRSNYEAGAEYVADVLNEEGEQYQLFRERGANQDGPAAVLAVPGTTDGWWLRSASPRRPGRFMTVDASGTPGYGRDADQACGLVFGFCL